MESDGPDALDRTFRALADASRRHLWQLLGERPGATTMELVAEVPRLSRWAVMKHLAVLREAGLVQTLPRGRQRCHYRVERALGAARSWIDAAAEAARGDPVSPPASPRAGP
jgi:predicted transcriptional regulator